MRKPVSRIFITVFVLFLLPLIAQLGVWAATERPPNWHEADWSSSGVLVDAARSPKAAVYIMAARTGGLKGAASVHTWIVTKDKNAPRYSRYDVVGWGKPVRKNEFPADGFWYSNRPEIIFQLSGSTATAAIAKIQTAIADYPFSKRGDYTIWPGPNSNTFVASIIQAVPELDTALPPIAIGKDYLSGSRWFLYNRDKALLKISLAGYAGLTLGRNEGFEVNMLGLVAGIGIKNPGIKLPGFGLIEWP